MHEILTASIKEEFILLASADFFLTQLRVRKRLKKSPDLCRGELNEPFPNCNLGLASLCLDKVFEMRFTMLSFWANVVQNIFQQFSVASLLFDTVINYSLELSQIYFFICFHHSFIVLIRSYRITSPASRQLKEFDNYRPCWYF